MQDTEPTAEQPATDVATESTPEVATQAVVEEAVVEAAAETVAEAPAVAEVAVAEAAPAEAAEAAEATPSEAAETALAEVAVTEAAPGEVADSAPAEVAETEVAPAAEAPVVDFRYQPGDIVPATITVIGANGIEADLGDGVIAVIPRAEIDGEPEVGQAIEGSVMKHQAGTGRYVISPRRAARSRAWVRVSSAFESGEPVSGVVKDVTKGGLIVDVGLRAFLPESLIDTRKPSNIRSLIGQQINVKIIECEKLSGEAAATERRSEKIVVNRRVLVESERKAARSSILAELAPGEARTGRVTAITEFGAFVDIGGIEGLVHVSELAHRQVAKVSDVVKVDDQIDVVILEVKADRGKISLSRKAALPNPWTQFQSAHKVGDLVYGTVTGLAAFGAFVMVEGEGFEPIEGLVHISELSRFRVESPSEVVAVGEGVWTQILAIEPDKKRLSLSLRRALE